MKGITKLFEKAISSPQIDQKDFIDDYKLTISGDIFRGKDFSEMPNGFGVLLTNKNELIEAYFKFGYVESGKIRILYSNGEYYEGEAKLHGVRHGEGVHYYANGDIYDGNFVDNLRVGKSRLRFHDGSEYIGQFIDDMADGTGIFNDKEGNRFMTLVDDDDHKRNIASDAIKDSENGYFLKGKIYGKGEIKFKNGNTYVGILKGTRRHGKGHMTFFTPPKNGFHSDIGDYQGNWKRDKRDGVGTMKYANGDFFEGLWKDDKM